MKLGIANAVGLIMFSVLGFFALREYAAQQPDTERAVEEREFTSHVGP